MKKKVLFLCTANSCRSQMAEGLANHFLGDRVAAVSAGTEASFVNPKAISVLQEIGIDISRHRSKNMTEFSGQDFDYVITLCADADEKCPAFFGGVKRTHLGFRDPAKAIGNEEQIMAEFRAVRDMIKNSLVEYFGSEEQQVPVSG
jgi:arsenate reductase